MKRCQVAILLLSQFLLCGQVFAQAENPYVPPSPNASSMIKFANVEVGYYTGVPNISIPLSPLAGNDVSIPISLDYHAAGVKVQDVSSSVGTGWNLNVGGMVTRVVRGLPDGGSKPDCISTNYNQCSSGQCDGERDIFYYSFLGRTGKMYSTGNGTVAAIPYQDLKITPNGISTQYWTIVDENGYTYYFGESTGSQDLTTYYVGDHTVPSYTLKDSYVSTWYLSRIMSPKGEQIATFTYRGNDLTFNMYGQTARRCSSPTINWNDVKVSIAQAKYIDQITVGTNKVLFQYSPSVRVDAGVSGALSLSSISYKDNAGNIMKSYTLDTDYFLGEFSSPNNRLRLIAVREGTSNPQIIHSFKYNDFSVGTTILNPARSSFWMDAYGYFNYNMGSRSQEPLELLKDEPGICSDPYAGNRNYSEGPNQVFSLREISNALGGRTVFAYENNSGVGLRIKSISTFKSNLDTDLQSKVTYTYSAAQGKKNPVFYYTASNGDIIRSSTAYSLLYDINGVAVGYSTVTESFLDGSKIIRGFTNFLDDIWSDDTAGPLSQYEGDPFSPTKLPLTIYFDYPSGVPFTPYSSVAWKRGLLTLVEVRDSQDRALSREEMAYKTDEILFPVQNMLVTTYRTDPGNFGYYVASYSSTTAPVQLKTKKSYFYDQNDLSKSIVKTTSYTYHSTLKTFPIEITSQSGTGAQQKVTFRYPLDVAGTGSWQVNNPGDLAKGCWYLINGHIITSLETLGYYKDYGAPDFNIVNGKLFGYGLSSTGVPLLKSAFDLSIGSSISSLTPATLLNGGNSYNYDSRYRLTQQYKYDNTALPVKVSSVIDSHGIEKHIEWLSSLNNFVTADYTTIASNQYRNQYSYNTINGLISSSDINNTTTSYEYDHRGRLKLVRDNDNNIISRNRFNYQNQNEFSADFTADNNAPKTVLLTSTFNDENIGNTKYIWDFGDNQIIENTSNSVTHTYSLSGTYMIKLAKVNPEYGSIVISHVIVVH